MYSFNMKWTIINYLFVELCLNKQIGPVTRSPEILCYSSINKSLLIYCCYLLNNWTWCLTTYILASWKKIYIYVHLFANKHERMYCWPNAFLILSTEFDIGNFFIIFNLINTLFRREKYSGVQIYVRMPLSTEKPINIYDESQIEWQDQNSMIILLLYIYIDIFFGTVSSSERYVFQIELYYILSKIMLRNN